MPPYILNFSTKRKYATCHLYGGCWRKVDKDLKNYQYVYDIEDLGDDVEFCQDCCPEYREKLAVSEDGSSSTEGRTSEESEKEAEAAERGRGRGRGRGRPVSAPKPKGRKRAVDAG